MEEIRVGLNLAQIGEASTIDCDEIDRSAPSQGGYEIMQIRDVTFIREAGLACESRVVDGIARLRECSPQHTLYLANSRVLEEQCPCRPLSAQRRVDNVSRWAAVAEAQRIRTVMILAIPPISPFALAVIIIASAL